MAGQQTEIDFTLFGTKPPLPHNGDGDDDDQSDDWSQESDRSTKRRPIEWTRDADGRTQSAIYKKDHLAAQIQRDRERHRERPYIRKRNQTQTLFSTGNLARGTTDTDLIAQLQQTGQDLLDWVTGNNRPKPRKFARQYAQKQYKRPPITHDKRPNWMAEASDPKPEIDQLATLGVLHDHMGRDTTRGGVAEPATRIPEDELLAAATTTDKDDTDEEGEFFTKHQMHTTPEVAHADAARHPFKTMHNVTSIDMDEEEDAGFQLDRIGDGPGYFTNDALYTTVSDPESDSMDDDASLSDAYGSDSKPKAKPNEPFVPMSDEDSDSMDEDEILSDAYGSDSKPKAKSRLKPPPPEPRVPAPKRNQSPESNPGPKRHSTKPHPRDDHQMQEPIPDLAVAIEPPQDDDDDDDDGDDSDDSGDDGDITMFEPRQRDSYMIPKGIEGELTRPISRYRRKAQERRDSRRLGRFSDLPIVLRPSTITNRDGLFSTDRLVPGSLIPVLKPFTTPAPGSEYAEPNATASRSNPGIVTITRFVYPDEEIVADYRPLIRGLRP